jgi:hypothetical protein
MDWHDEKGADSNSVWCDGKASYATYSWLGETLTFENIALAIASSAAICEGITTIIPPLLLDLGGARKITSFDQCKRSLDEIVDGKQCYCLELMTGKTVTKLWVDVTDFTLRMFAEYVPDSLEDAIDALRRTGMSHRIPELLSESDPDSFPDIERLVKFNGIELNKCISDDVFKGP